MIALSFQGKTLSLLSATFTWLDDDKNRARQGQLDALAGSDGAFLPDVSHDVAWGSHASSVLDAQDPIG